MPHLGSGPGAGASRLGYVLMAVSVALLLPLHAFVASGRVGLAAQAFAVAVLVWARLTFGLRSFHATATPTSGGLVTRGPYAFVRHPIYASILLFVWAAVASHLSRRTVGCGLLTCLGAALRIAAEERLVLARYPEYAAYASHTKRLIPHVF